MKRSKPTAKDSYTITLGYLWRWGQIVIVFLIPTITYFICKLGAIPSETEGYAVFFAFGASFLCVGIYGIIGTALEFKHIHVALQLAYRTTPNPQKSWTKAEKRESTAIGIIFTVLGSAIITLILLSVFGIF